MAKPVTCSDQLFKGRQFERAIIILCVRWYLRFKLSFRDPVEMMAESGLSLAHTTIMRWVQRFVPEFERRWNHFARQSGQSWRVDETDIKIRGVWTYLYRAVDRNGKTVDFRLSSRRDVAAAKSFFRRALKTHKVGQPFRMVSATLGVTYQWPMRNRDRHHPSRRNSAQIISHTHLLQSLNLQQSLAVYVGSFGDFIFPTV